jgi:hypothetical protein
MPGAPETIMLLNIVLLVAVVLIVRHFVKKRK